jgi:hypothetical protein
MAISIIGPVEQSRKRRPSFSSKIWFPLLRSSVLLAKPGLGSQALQVIHIESRLSIATRSSGQRYLRTHPICPTTISDVQPIPQSIKSAGLN